MLVAFCRMTRLGSACRNWSWRTRTARWRRQMFSGVTRAPRRGRRDLPSVHSVRRRFRDGGVGDCARGPSSQGLLPSRVPSMTAGGRQETTPQCAAQMLAQVSSLVDRSHSRMQSTGKRLVSGDHILAASGQRLRAARLLAACSRSPALNRRWATEASGRSTVVLKAASRTPTRAESQWRSSAEAGAQSGAGVRTASRTRSSSWRDGAMPSSSASHHCSSGGAPSAVATSTRRCRPTSMSSPRRSTSPSV